MTYNRGATPISTSAAMVVPEAAAAAPAQREQPEQWPTSSTPSPEPSMSAGAPKTPQRRRRVFLITDVEVTPDAPTTLTTIKGGAA